MDVNYALAVSLPCLVALTVFFSCGLPTRVAWTPETYPDPSKLLSQCRSSGLAGRICDPDRVLSSTGNMVAEGILKDIFHAAHPYSSIMVNGWLPCRAFREQGFEVRWPLCTLRTRHLR